MRKKAPALVGNLHGDHLHVSALQIPVQVVCAICNGNIVGAIDGLGTVVNLDLLLRVGTELGTFAHRGSELEGVCWQRRRTLEGERWN